LKQLAAEQTEGRIALIAIGEWSIWHRPVSDVIVSRAAASSS